MSKAFKLALVDANYLIYHAAWESRDYPLASSSVLRKKLAELLVRLQEHTDEVILFADSKEEVPAGQSTRHILYAPIRKYKGNRKDSEEIKAVKEVVRAALMEWTVHVPGYEADDLLYTAWMNHEPKADLLIVSGDKDMDNIHGWHLDPGKGYRLYFVDSAQSVYNFWLQMLSGDTQDNIRGVPGCGPIGAGRLLISNDPANYNKVVRDEYIRVLGPVEGHLEFEITKQTVGFWFCDLMPPGHGRRKIEDLLKEL